mmetsp:Transcript_18501/g.33139  ORF Transcript_18501/g.33139 Transcript_18501/m.33139 type:complete len:585 (-) Transcript_18501:74-1828(-)
MSLMSAMELDDGPNRVQVFARVRPALPHQRSCVQTSEEARAVCVHENAHAHVFVFDGVLPEATQEQVFLKVGVPVVHECSKGFNGSILAYGQTGSGKTHSLFHEGENPIESGLLPRAVAEIFRCIDQDPSSIYDVEGAAMQVYNEQLDDLLHPQHKSGDGEDLVVQNGGDVLGLTWVLCKNARELTHVFARAQANLVYAETKMNKVSSRGHAIFQVRLTKRTQSHMTCSKLSIVDLAGSERVKKSGVEGTQFKETAAINKSLLAFGNVARALAAKKRHVPFRDSKLTHVLSACMGGNCKTSLLVCSSPAEEHVAETLCSLDFASRAMQIEIHARMNRMAASNSEAVFQAFARAQQAEAAATETEQDVPELQEKNTSPKSHVQSSGDLDVRKRLQRFQRMQHIELMLAEALQEADLCKTELICANDWKSRRESAEQTAKDAMQRIEGKLAQAVQDAVLCRALPLCAATHTFPERFEIRSVDAGASKANVWRQVCAPREVQPVSTEHEQNHDGHASLEAAYTEECKYEEIPRAKLQQSLLKLESSSPACLHKAVENEQDEHSNSRSPSYPRLQANAWRQLEAQRMN